MSFLPLMAGDGCCPHCSHDSICLCVFSTQLSTPIPGPSFRGFCIRACSRILWGDVICLSYERSYRPSAESPGIPSRSLSIACPHLAWESPPASKLPPGSSLGSSVSLGHLSPQRLCSLPLHLHLNRHQGSPSLVLTLNPLQKLRV